MPIDSEDVFLSGDDAEAMLGVPVVGFVPTVEEPGLRLIRDNNAFSPLREAYRALRVNLSLLVENPLHSLVITSSVPAEGKSVTLANLAMTVAMRLDRNRIVVVDADLRRPSQHKLFQVESSPGLTDVLAGTHTLEQALRPTVDPNVSLLPAGTPPLNPTELLESDAMRRLLTYLEQRYDLVLLDTPPLLAVADAMVVASLADGVLVVIGQGETKKSSVQKTMHLLARARTPVVGTVLNRIPGASSGYYYGRQYVPAPMKEASATSEDATIETKEAEVGGK